MKSIFLILVVALSSLSGCGLGGTAPAALGAMKLQDASRLNEADYQMVVNTLTDNMTMMFSKQLQLLAERELLIINQNPDENLRAQQTATLLDNQELARNEFMEKLNLMRSQLLNAPNFKLAVKLSGAVSQYLGQVDETAQDIQSIFDQFKSEPSVDKSSITLKSLMNTASAGATKP